MFTEQIHLLKDSNEQSFDIQNNSKNCVSQSYMIGTRQ